MEGNNTWYILQLQVFQSTDADIGERAGRRQGWKGRQALAQKRHAIRLTSVDFIFNRNSLKKCKQGSNISDLHFILARLL